MDHVEFGRYLTQQRELRGMTREQVSQVTKIPGSVLSALEAGQVEKLPSRVFVLNYIRSYAQVIGLSPDEAVLRYDEIFTGSETTLSPVEQERRRKRKAFGMMTVVGILVAGGAVFALWWTQFR